jgi:hypothetical protein
MIKRIRAIAAMAAILCVVLAGRAHAQYQPLPASSPVVISGPQMRSELDKRYAAVVGIKPSLMPGRSFNGVMMPSATPTPTATSTPAGQPTPPPLSNPQNPVSFGADASGSADATSAFQSAANAGDIHVPSGTFKINGQVNLNSRSMYCGAGAVLWASTAQSQRMFRIYNSVNQSMFNCHFRGPNYNQNSPAYHLFPQDFVWVIPPSTNFRMVGNDFNGAGGYTGAIDVYAGAGPAPVGTYIGYNNFDHCDYYAIQVTAGQNTHAEFNTSNDCAWWVEADDNGQTNTGNVANDNHVTFTFGTGDSQNAGGGRFGSEFTCGHDASSSAYNYSGNYCKNNTVDGPYASYLQMDATGTPARYCGNTCTGGCITTGSQSSPPCP